MAAALPQAQAQDSRAARGRADRAYGGDLIVARENDNRLDVPARRAFD
jgi:hypothetical protein